MPADNDRPGAAQGGKAFQRVGIKQHQVGATPRCNRAILIGQAEETRWSDGCGIERLARREPDSDIEVKFVEQGDPVEKVGIGERRIAGRYDLNASPMGLSAISDQRFVYGVRPEGIEIASDGMAMTIEAVEPTGPDLHLVARSGGTRLVISSKERLNLRPGDDVSVRISAHAAHLFDEQTGLRRSATHAH